MSKQYYVYILSSYTNQVLYIGMTNNLVRRIYEHKNKLIEGFSSRYNLSKLVFYEIYDNVENAILREKQLKKWRHSKKDFLIKQINPEYNDLYENILY